MNINELIITKGITKGVFRKAGVWLLVGSMSERTGKMECFVCFRRIFCMFHKNILYVSEEYFVCFRRIFCMFQKNILYVSNYLESSF